MKVVFTDEARGDLYAIGDHIAEGNPRRAVTFVQELEERCAGIVHQPLAYVLVPRHEASGIRRVVHGRYLIFYRVEPERVVILHVLGGEMDYEAILFGGQ